MDLQLFERNCLIEGEITHARASQFRQVSANVQTFAEVFCECSDVRTGRTRDPRVKIEGAVEIIFDELAVRPDRGELVNAHVYWLTLNVLTTARKFVEPSPLNFFC